MAKANSNAIAMLLLELSLLVSLLLLVSTVDGRLIDFGSTAATTPTCNTAYSVALGDTCFAVAQEFNLTSSDFSAINPNLDCDKLFVGQWLCGAGTA